MIQKGFAAGRSARSTVASNGLVFALIRRLSKVAVPIPYAIEHGIYTDHTVVFALELLGQIEGSPLKSLAKTQRLRMEAIVAMWRFSKSK